MMLSSSSSCSVRRSSLATSRQLLSVVSPLVTDHQESNGQTEKNGPLLVSSSRRRLFSSSPPRRGGGRGGRGRGGSGRGAGALHRFRERRASEAKKTNFAKQVLEPAARGELQKGHTSGIPRLLGRKKKGHAIHDVLSKKEVTHLKDYVEDKNEGEEEEDISSSLLMQQQTSGVSVGLGRQAAVVVQEEEYDSEEEYDDLEGPMTLAQFEQHPDVTKNEDGTYVIEYDSDWGEDDDDDVSKHPKKEDPRGRRGNDRPPSPFDVNPEVAFFYKDVMDFSDPFPDVPDEQANRLLPLANHGENLDDFLQVMIEHPSKYAEVKRYNLHPESKREAQVEFPPDRQDPEVAFVKKFKRFLLVTGLPHAVVDEELGDIENPLHRHEVIKTVADLFHVKPEQVSPANMTSAFVGYMGKEERDKALAKGPSQKTFDSPIVISKYDEKEQGGDFVKTNPEAIVKLSNLAVGCTAEYLSQNLFPDDTEVGSIYGPLTSDNVQMTSPTTALVRFASAEQAESAIQSSLLQQHLVELGKTRVRCFVAKRELLDGGFSGPNQAHEIKKKGTRLVVDGDVPSKGFYRSHYQVVQLDNVDDQVTKQEIADFFQPYCTEQRDVEGSVEFVTCFEGLKTGRAFVGFDMLGEADAVLRALDGGEARIGNNVVSIKAVHDRAQRRGELRETRPLRSEEELLDSLNNWEKYVDPEDLLYLGENGVHRDVLDSVFRTMRFHNKTFGPTDLAMQREKLSPELESGEIYKKTVVEYIRILKECIATPEDPGLMYKGMFLPGETMDLSAFDREKERQEKLKALRNKAIGGGN